MLTTFFISFSNIFLKLNIINSAPILSLPGTAPQSFQEKKAAVHRPRAALLGQLIQRKRAGDAPSPNRDCLCGHLFALGRTKQEMGLQGRSRGTALWNVGK
ncbi:hypothetical protein CEXT_231481 [Caerostris extrusa]|uniref:Uncharacterized protein n=1 Tax=Caerostris extrusa TaxID=172846 RepID=A0AAV4RDD3_CAEEX|nr:hypothetical protein CEXT_231481 [Caerostris extrusa]